MRSALRIALVSFVLAIVAALGLVVVYLRGGQPQWEGALLLVALGGIGVGLLAWASRLLPEVRDETQPRPARAAVERTGGAGEEIQEGVELLRRRSLLASLLVGALGALGLAALFPIRSLGRAPGSSLERTAWTAGTRLVRSDGSALTLDSLVPGSTATVFPEGHEGSADAQAVVVRVEPGQLALPADKQGAALEDAVCYSKICTHAGCPLGLYLAETQELRCPCHQSTFAVLTGGQPVYGPAARALPMLPIEVGDDGVLVARGDFTEPVGPAFWELDVS